MRRICLAEPAREDLLSLWEFVVDQSGVNVADGLAADFKAAFRRLARNPNIGHTRLGLAPPDVLFYRVRSFLVVFRVASRQLQVLRVLHSARDVAWLLTPGREPLG